MDANNRLHGRQRIFPRIGGVIDEGFGDLHVLRETRDEIDVAFAVPIDRGTEVQVFLDRLFEIVVQVGEFLQNSVQILARKCQ